MHAKLNTASSARMLGEAQLGMGKNVEAEEMLAALDTEKTTVATRSLHGLALARLDKVAKAKEIANGLAVSAKCGPKELYCAARLQAVVGNAPEAVDLLKTCMENVPTSLPDGYRSRAEQCEDFASLSSTDGFSQALAIKSKIAESECSGGSKCAGCPSRGKCDEVSNE
jgi:hypothetical protein